MACKMINREYLPTIDGYRKEFICDTEEDIASLPKCDPSSVALVSDGGKVYIVNASGKWVEFGWEA